MSNESDVHRSNQGERHAMNAVQWSRTWGPFQQRRAALWMLAVMIGSAAGTAQAQTSGCSLTSYTDPPREVLDCANGLSVTAEKSATYKLVDRNRDGQPEALEVTNKGVLIEWSARRRGGFQVLTPHAIASVRGTVWAVDVKSAATSVFVQSGRVGVTRPSGGAASNVVLNAGDGVDVSSGGGPLERKRWPRERALHLLARFGR